MTLADEEAHTSVFRLEALINIQSAQEIGVTGDEEHSPKDLSTLIGIQHRCWIVAQVV